MVLCAVGYSTLIVVVECINHGTGSGRMSRHVTNGIHDNGANGSLRRLIVDSASTALLMMLLLHFVKQRDRQWSCGAVIGE
jgi:hypothetical protein